MTVGALARDLKNVPDTTDLLEPEMAAERTSDAESLDVDACMMSTPVLFNVPILYIKTVLYASTVTIVWLVRVQLQTNQLLNRSQPPQK